MMRLQPRILLSVLLVAPFCVAQQPESAPNAAVAAPVRADFHIRYINGSNVYIDAGRDAGLAEGTKLVLKQDPSKAETDKTNVAIEPGIVAKLTVVAVASTSAVCEVSGTTRALAVGDVVTLPDTEVEKLVEKNTLGNTRKYPMVVSFSEGDPLDEEVREALPRPPLPEVNQMRGRIGFDVSTIRQLGQGGGSSNSYGMVFRADFTRIFGTHFNLNGYWRGNLRTSSGPSQTSLQDLINRTYLMSLTYVNPDSHWTGGVGRLYLPWASSLEAIDGAYVARQSGSRTVTGIFAGSTPDPTAWNYNPQRRIGGVFFNVHGGATRRFDIQARQGLESRCSSGLSTGHLHLPRTISHSNDISPCITLCRLTGPRQIHQRRLLTPAWARVCSRCAYRFILVSLSTSPTPTFAMCRLTILPL
jgi:hypothetical protein